MAILSCSISKPVHPSARQKTEVKRHTLTSFENDSFFFSFFQMLELMKVLLFYPHKFSTLQTKLAGKSRAMQALDIFFLCFNSKTQWDKKRIPLTYSPQLKDRSIFGMDQAWSNFNNNTRLSNYNPGS